MIMGEPGGYEKRDDFAVCRGMHRSLYQWHPRRLCRPQQHGMESRRVPQFNGL